LPTITNISRIIALVLTTLSTFAYPKIAPNAGISRVISKWDGRPLNSTLNLLSWPHDFTTGIQPLPLQSHNDFERPHPLFDALSVGCTAFAADIVPQVGDLEGQILVAHDSSEVDVGRTLQSLYIDPLLTILDHANVGRRDGDMIRGVYDDEPEQSVTLFLDLKDEPSPELWEALNRAVQPLADRGYLTFWTADDTMETDEASSSVTNLTSPITGAGRLHVRPITLAGTGETPFPLILNASPNATHRHIFMDAPLISFLDPPSGPFDLADKSTYTYDPSTSHTASACLFHHSVSLGDSIPLIFGIVTSAQRRRIQTLVIAAQQRGLKARFWGIKGLPVARTAVWRVLMEEMGMGDAVGRREAGGYLVVDEIDVAAGIMRAMDE